MKIAITGTHGAGKTTLCYLMAAYYKKIGKNVKVVDEVARDCPFPINEGMSRKTVDWIYHEHCKRELEAESRFEIVISDRTQIDSLIYGYHFNLNYLPVNGISEYDKIILVEPDLPIKEDGTRSTDETFQKEIEKIFKEFLEDVDCVKIKSSDIFDEGEKWKLYCL